jgi:hypothetical protein
MGEIKLKKIYLIYKEGVIVDWTDSTEWNLPSVTIDENHDFFSNPSNYRFLDGELVNLQTAELEYAKKEKFDYLNFMCQKEIFGYFKVNINGVEYDFSFDKEAQANFTGTMLFFSTNMIQEVEWTAWKNGIVQRLTLDKNTFLNIATTGFNFKNSRISKLRNVLEPQLNECTTLEEINNINW